MESAALSRLDDNFYSQVAEFLNKKREEAFVSKSILVIKEYENIKKVVQSILSKREEKLVLLTLRGQQVDGLTLEEQDMLQSISQTVQKYRSKVFEVINTDAQEHEHPLPKIRKIKILRDVEQYKGLDNNVYGPFKTGEETTLPMQEADWLLKSHLAELL